MAPRAGAIVAPGDLKEGDLVQAKDPGGFWYNAKVICKRGGGRNASVMVHYVGFPHNQDEKFTGAKKGVRWRLPAAELAAEREAKLWGGRTDGRNDDGTWRVERIIAKRYVKKQRQFLVRWEGWDDSHDSWEKNLSQDLIDEYEEEQEALAEARRNPPRSPPVPFSAALVEGDSAEVVEWRINETDDIVSDLADEAGVKLARRKVAAAEVKVYTTKPVSAGAFHALRARFARSARQAQPGREVDNAVTPVASLRRGVRPVDVFSVMCDDEVNTIMGAGVFKIQHNTNRAAVKLVAPLDFFLKAKRDVSGELRQVKELVVKAHFVALVPDHANPAQPIFRYDDAAFDYPSDNINAYKRAMAAQLLAAGPAGLGPVSGAFMAWANVHVNA